MTTTFAVQHGKTLNAPPATTSDAASVRAAQWLTTPSEDAYERAERRAAMPGEWVAAHDVLDAPIDA